MITTTTETPPPPLSQFSDQFKEVREAARLAREKSQERFELTNPALNIAAPQVSPGTLTPKRERE